MDLKPFKNSLLGQDLEEAFKTEYYSVLCQYLGKDRPQWANQRYKITGFPLPTRYGRCWCPERSENKCVDWTRNCPRRPIRKLADGFEIIECKNCIPSKDGKPGRCDLKSCWGYYEPMTNWLALFYGTLEEQGFTVSIESRLREKISKHVRKYGFDDDKISEYTDIICYMTEEVRKPSRQSNMSWMPEVQGVLWWDNISIENAVDNVLFRLTNAKKARENKEDAEGLPRQRSRP